MDLVVVPLASRIHGTEYYLNLLKEFSNIFSSYNVKVLDVADSDEAINDELINIVSNSIPILLILTGGCSKLAVELISRCNVKRVLIVSHPQHNSLASAISVRSKLELEGIAVRNYFCNNLSRCSQVVERAIKVGRALIRLLGVNVGVIASELGEEVKHFEEVLSAKVVLITYDELSELINETTEEEVGNAINVINRSIKLEGLSYEALRKVIKIYIAMKKLVASKGLNALAIDCFPYLMRFGVTPCLAVALLNAEGVPTACEGDLRSLALMLIARSLDIKSSWIANIASVDGRTITLAHCTIAPTLGVNCMLVPHFESGNPYAVTCKLHEGVYTIAGIDREYSAIATLKAKLISSGLLSNDMCRTQAILRADVDLSELPNISLSNHHLLIPGDIVSDLREVTYLLFMDFATYDSIIRHLTGEL